MKDAFLVRQSVFSQLHPIFLFGFSLILRVFAFIFYYQFLSEIEFQFQMLEKIKMSNEKSLAEMETLTMKLKEVKILLNVLSICI